MVQLLNSDIRSREVLQWRGLHVFHARVSSCSQKLRIFLNLKGIPWESHLIDLARNENLGDFYLGVNPRGLVPAIVHDGTVHIESNDIILYIEEKFPQPELVPAAHRSDIAALLHHEDELHLDLRTLSFRFVFAPPKPPKSADDLKRYAEQAGSATVRGQHDPNIDREISFWNEYTDHGITDVAVRESAHKFKAALHELEQRLVHAPYLLGNSLSVLDIAWFIYVQRLLLCGYPMARLHPKVSAWASALLERREFADEVATPPPLKERVPALHQDLEQRGKTLERIADL